MTNGDKIRSMTDEELREFIPVSICNSVGICQNGKSCTECQIEWLKQECKDADSD